MPNINGTFALIGAEGVCNLEGAFSHCEWGGCQGFGHHPYSNPIVNFNASKCNSVYGYFKNFSTPSYCCDFLY